MKNLKLTQFAIADLDDAPESPTEDGNKIVVNFAERVLTTASLISGHLGLPVEWEAYEDDDTRGILQRIHVPSGSVEFRPLDVANAIPRDPRCFSAVRRDQAGEGERTLNRFVVERVLAPLRAAGVDVSSVDPATVGQDVIAFDPNLTVPNMGRKCIAALPMTESERKEADKEIFESLSALSCLAAEATGIAEDVDLSQEDLVKGAIELWHLASTQVENGRLTIDRRACGADSRYARFRLQGALARMATKRAKRGGRKPFNTHALAADLISKVVLTPSKS